MRERCDLPALFLPCLLLLNAPAASAERPLARVDGRSVSGDDLVEAFTSQHGGHSAFLTGEDEVRRALDGVIDDILLLHEAERLELDRHPTVEAAVEGWAESLALRRLIEAEIDEPAKPTADEVRSAYEAFTTSLLNVRQIVVPDHATAEEIAGRIGDGAAFDELARERSQAASARNGGQLPPIPWGSMSAEWDAAVFALEPGEISPPFWNGESWEIVQLVERFPINQPAYEDAAKAIEGILHRRKLAERRRLFSNELIANHEAAVALQPYDLATWRRAMDHPDTVVATWEGGALTAGEMVERLDLEELATRTAEQAAREIQAQVRGALNDRLGRLEAKSRALAESPDIQAEVATRREEAMAAVLHGEFIFRGIEVTDAEVRAWYAEHPEEMTRAERRRVGQILVETEEEALAASRRLAAGEPFEELAGELSKDWDSARKGGDLGWVTQEDAPPGLDGVFSLAEGEVSQPLSSALGWHLIRVTAIEPARALAFEEVRQDLYQRLLRNKRRAEQERWVALLREAASIEIDDEAVRDFVAELAES